MATISGTVTKVSPNYLEIMLSAKGEDECGGEKQRECGSREKRGSETERERRSERKKKKHILFPSILSF